MAPRLYRRLFVVTLIVLSCGRLLPSQTQAENRSALVLGTAVEGTTTVEDDATSVAKALRELGFNVIQENNASKSRIDELLTAWTTELKKGGVGLFYYAGHGAQINGLDYVRPNGSILQKLGDVKNTWIGLDKILGALGDAPLRLRFVLLDACRDNPLLATLALEDRSGDIWFKGLAEPKNAPRNTLVSFATNPGNIARDPGSQPHSPYTTALLKYIRQPGLTVDELFRSMGTYVEGATFDAQVPWINSSFRPEFYFRDPSYLIAKLGAVDDELLALIDGQEVLSSSNIPPAGKRIPLHSGRNSLTVKVYNQHTFTGGVDLSDLYSGLPPGPGHLPEGWNYSLQLSSTDNVNLVNLSGREDLPKKNGPHHGHLFTVATADIIVDETSGEVRLANVDQDVWKGDK